jgi:VWFA-related protein
MSEYRTDGNTRVHGISFNFRLYISLFLLQIIVICFSPPVKAQQDTIKLSTDLVVIDAQVLNRKTGEVIHGLNARDFELYEEGTPQEITHFSQDKLALSVILLIDLSGSVSPVLSDIRDGALMALSRLKEQDEVAVMFFSNSTQLSQDFTTDRQAIVGKISLIEKAPVIGQGTLLYPALRDAALHMAKASNPLSRRVIIAITDNISWDYYGYGVSEKEVTDRIIESGSMVCGLIVEGTLSKAERLFRRGHDGKDVFRRRMTIDAFANQTGGELINAPGLEIHLRLAQLIDHLRTRYSLGFTPRRDQADGGFRQIKLALTTEARKRYGDVVIKTKQGYYAKRRNQS